jgi:hypothetical protein
LAGRLRRLLSTAASSSAIVVLAISSYWVLHNQPPTVGVWPTPALQALQRQAVPGPLEAATAVRTAPMPYSGATPVPGAAKYVVSIARHTDRKAAEVHARRVRAKGYGATVVRDGSGYSVVTHTYKNEAAARKAARILTEIGFTARVMALREVAPVIKDESSYHRNFA